MSWNDLSTFGPILGLCLAVAFVPYAFELFDGWRARRRTAIP